MYTELEVIKLEKSTIIKYHISKNRTAIMTIKDGDASFEVKDYGPTLPLIEVEEKSSMPDQNLREGQIWSVRLQDHKGIIEVKIAQLFQATVTLVPTIGGWRTGYLIDAIDWIERQ